MKRIALHLLAGILLLLMTCNGLWAQATAQINGVAQDPSGAVLPGVEITATQTETGVSRMTVSNETGLYTLPNLPLGPYKLEASLPGFRTFSQTGIVLAVGDNPRINITLQVGQVSEQVEVQANASLVETRNVSVAQVMETQRILDLPLNVRDPAQLVLLNGASMQVTPAGGYGFGGTRMAIATAGGFGTGTDYTLDGIRHIDPFDSLPLPLPFPDALSEFKTEIGGQSASQGRGSQVSAVTKSGTNQFHGDAFEFVRNDLFNARQYFAVKNSTLKRNQFGGTFGGPIVQNKVFFFGGFQGTTTRQDPGNSISYVPTAAMMAGDFTAFSSAACNSKGAIKLGGPFVNNKIDPKLFDPVAVKMVSYLPTTTDPCGQITYGAVNPINDKQWVTKIDYTLNEKHSIFGRILSTYEDNLSPQDQQVLGRGINRHDRNYAVTLGSTYLLTPTTVNAFRISVSEVRQNSTAANLGFDMSSLGSKVYDYTPKAAIITITSGFSFSSTGRRIGSGLYQLADDVSLTRGKHQFGFGGRLAQVRTVATTSDTSIPGYTYTGQFTGTGLSDFLLGDLSSFVQGRGSNNFTRMKYISLYMQDTWQVKPRLTVSAGLRWNPVLPLQAQERPVGNVTNFNESNYLQGIRSAVFPLAPPGLLYAGDPGFQQGNNGANAAKPSVNSWNPYWKDFAPRLGFAWDIRGDGKTSLRASYGLNYEEYGALYRLGTWQQTAPWGSSVTLTSPAGGTANPWLGVPGGNPFPFIPSANTPFVPDGIYQILPANLSPTYTQSWNLSLQREVVPGTVASVAYIGTEVTHLQAAIPLNQSIFIPGNGDANGNCFLNGSAVPFTVKAGTACSTTANTQDRRRLSLLRPQFKDEIARMGEVINPGTQNYNAVMFSIQNRPRRGVTASANYTLSHCIGDYVGRSNSGYGTSIDQVYQDSSNRRKDRGNCEIDSRNSFNLTALGESPKFANHIANMLGSGWRLSGLYRAFDGGINAANISSGVRTVTLATASSSQKGGGVQADQCLCDVSNQRPNLLLPNAVYLQKAGPSAHYLNPAAFGVPALGTLGNLGRATLKLPMNWQFDVALTRAFKVRETKSFEIRAEAFNVLNSFRPGGNNGGPVFDANLNSAQFGVMLKSQDPRIMQFAMKYVF
jgi:hypothetical protein